MDRSSESVFECAVAAGELFADAGGGLPGEPGVCHGVVADEVSGGGYGAGDVRALTDEAADHEEGRADVVAAEECEESFGSDVVGAVVVGEGDLARALRGDQDFAEDLRAGPEGGVGARSGGGGGGGDRRRRRQRRRRQTPLRWLRDVALKSHSRGWMV